MSNNHEIKTIVAELQSMSPRTQLEIVRLCKRVAELTPDYIDDITDEQYAAFTAALNQAKTELQSQITTNANNIESNANNIESNTTAINNEKTAREDVIGVNVAGNTYIKTATPNKQILINNNGLIDLSSNNNNVEITAPSGHVRMSTDNSSVMANEANGVTLSTNESDNPNIVILRPNGDFEVSNEHTLKFANNGKLTIDGNEVGGGGGVQLYEHNVFLYQSGATDINITLTIITASNTPFTFNTLVSFINTNNGTPNDLRNCTGFFKGSDDTTMRFANSCYATNSTELNFIGRAPNSAQITLSISSIAFLNDKVRTI